MTSILEEKPKLLTPDQMFGLLVDEIEALKLQVSELTETMLQMNNGNSSGP